MFIDYINVWEGKNEELRQLFGFYPFSHSFDKYLFVPGSELGIWGNIKMNWAGIISSMSSLFEVGDKVGHSFIHSFIQQMCTEHLLCYRCSSKPEFLSSSSLHCVRKVLGRSDKKIIGRRLFLWRNMSNNINDSISSTCWVYCEPDTVIGSCNPPTSIEVGII